MAERELCFQCLRPKRFCYCKYTKPVESGIKFIFLTHPKEVKRQKTGTGRLAHLCLPQSEILMGIDFTQNERLNSLLHDERYVPLLMYPSPLAVTADSPVLKEKLYDNPPQGMQKKIPLVLIIDSTWFCSKKMLKLSKNLFDITKLSFKEAYKSIFTFKTEPAEHCISTIESCYYLIKEMQEASLAPKDIDPEPLMDVFKKMIQFQLEKENERITLGLPSTHPKDYKYTKLKEIPTFN